ncbi:MAG: radical SAM protein [Alphaproteobacteria bacterium]
MTDRKRVFFNEYNVMMDNTTYLPLVSGLLQSFAETSPVVRDHFEFMPYLFHLDRPAAILDAYDRPAIAAFSLVSWNEQLNLFVAAEVKRRYPDCLIVFGGPQVPHHPEPYFRRHPFIDAAVRGEGEEPFLELLERVAGGRDPDGIPGVSWRTAAGEFRENPGERPFVRDMDAHPSPYLKGHYDDLMTTHPHLTFQAIIETNRGCPFHCTFCFWGRGGLSRKYRYRPLDQVEAEIKWMAEHHIRYVYNADSNFGMHRRDMDIAHMLVETKRRYGFPEKFRTCYGKNTDEAIFEIGRLFHQNQIEKGITISYQSCDPVVQKNIKRDNIKIAVAADLHQRFNESDVPVYTEMILGLPGETTKSWVAGIESILSSGLRNHLFMYVCNVFPNIELAEPAYRQQFGIITRTIEMAEVHGAIRPADWLTEYEEIIIGTDSMPTPDWRRMMVFSWFVGMLHSLKLANFLLIYLVGRFGVRYTDLPLHLADGGFDRRFDLWHFERNDCHAKLDALLAGGPRGCTADRWGAIYWEQEELGFLRLGDRRDEAFDQLEALTRDYLTGRGFAVDEAELHEAVTYQRLRVSTVSAPPGGTIEHAFTTNMPEFFDRYHRADRVGLERRPQGLVVTPKDFGGDPERYARESILWGRRSGLTLAPCSWKDLA